MIVLVRTSHPATGVEHSIYASFYRSEERNLVVAGANVLKVFQLIPENNKVNEIQNFLFKKTEKSLKWKCLTRAFKSSFSMTCLFF